MSDEYQRPVADREQLEHTLRDMRAVMRAQAKRIAVLEARVDSLSQLLKHRPTRENPSDLVF